jgi:CRISPR/Cas system CMR-associated protein Cmr3 (group 5 of RAMP superfamily)
MDLTKPIQNWQKSILDSFTGLMHVINKSLYVKYQRGQPELRINFCHEQESFGEVLMKRRAGKRNASDSLMVQYVAMAEVWA